MPSAFLESDLAALLRLNHLRAVGPSQELRDLEARFDSKFGAGSRLAVYGTLAPGRSNHHQISSLEGEWIAGLSARGELLSTGWGDQLGYPALRWSMSAAEVEVQLFVSAELPRQWRRLDAFEGRDYVRILVPLFAAGQVVEVANLYQASAECLARWHRSRALSAPPGHSVDPAP